MDRETYQRGLEIRSAVLGEAYVNKALADADRFTKPLQDLITEYCWGAVWGRDGLTLKTRSMLNLAMIPILNRPNELRTHIKAALTNGVSRDEIREIFLQVAIYAGVPAAVDSFRIASEVFAEGDHGWGWRLPSPTVPEDAHDYSRPTARMLLSLHKNVTYQDSATTAITRADD